jgi:glycosyltransferase involved in cell wall biosynthesis
MQAPQPFVSVVTPVYNGEPYLAECIESVLSQSFTNFEYLIVNNCSRDRTLQIAQDYAQKDRRIRVIDNTEFLDVISNHNHAFRMISPDAKYCKVVSGDDLIFPDCLARLVELAEANPGAGIIGCYQLSGDQILWQGFNYPKAIFTGREVCRQIFLDGDPKFGFGSPTSLLYRADLICSSAAFYPNLSPHSDTSACFEHLQHSTFGFVYQVLCYERKHEATQTSKSREMNRYAPAYLNDLLKYGPAYLSGEELDRKVHAELQRYHRFLAVNYFVGFRNQEFWDYHKSRLAELGFPLTQSALWKGAVQALLHKAGNPGLAMKRIRERLGSGRSKESIPKPIRPTTPTKAGRS